VNITNNKNAKNVLYIFTVGAGSEANPRWCEITPKVLANPEFLRCNNVTSTLTKPSIWLTDKIKRPIPWLVVRPPVCWLPFQSPDHICYLEALRERHPDRSRRFPTAMPECTTQYIKANTKVTEQRWCPFQQPSVGHLRTPWDYKWGWCIAWCSSHKASTRGT